MMMSGGYFVKNIYSFFVLIALFYFFKQKKYRNHVLILSFIYVNTAFYRLAEHGTDRSALILIFLLVITYLESLNILNNPFNKKNFIEYYEKIIVLLLLIVSLKSFYLIYLSLFLLWFYQFRLLLFDKNLEFLQCLYKDIDTLFCLFSSLFFCPNTRLYLKKICYVFLQNASSK